ncbi:MAG: 2-oxoacid:acceptor oxidoreductase subunit alpha [Verrucomicrobiota bacterium]|mgnify:CR=1 FL=1|nr:2-oxoacid:acceptor oxidoreductase subunit alpha [Verrucomicrobiota bacterium]
MSKVDFAIAIGGEAGQGIAAAGDVFAFALSRNGYHLNAYNAFQSIIRGGHIFLTIRVSDEPLKSHGDKIDFLLCLNQDTMDRHLKLMKAGSYVLFDGDKIKPGEAAAGVNLCPLPVKEVQGANTNKLNINTIGVGAILSLIGIDFKFLQSDIAKKFKKKGDAVIEATTNVAKAGYEYATANFKSYAKLEDKKKPLGFIEGNSALAMAGAAAGVKFYCAYPMSPSTGVLHWFSKYAERLGIMVRQVEDEIGVANMAYGAAATGARTMFATSGGGFALMTEALGAASIMEIPVVAINVQRGGPGTGLPTKTEQADLWQALGAGHGDYPRVIVAPTSIDDCYSVVPEIFNLTDKLQCPGIILSDLLISEGRGTIDTDKINLSPKIDRGEMIFPDAQSKDNPYGGYNDMTYLRYKNTPSGISPRAVIGTPGHIFTAASDDHDEDGTLISDEFTNPAKRVMMHEKRMRKLIGAEKHVPAPKLVGPENADVTLVGWGSTEGVVLEAIEKLAAEEGIVCNQLQIRWIVPFHGEEIINILSKSKKVIIVENNYSGQFARYLRSETGFNAHSHIRKYDGEPFMPHHIVDGVKEIKAKNVAQYVPVHEICV